MSNSIDIPDWVNTLVAIGERFEEVASNESSKRLTVVLCLPCIDFAAAFLGIGILKSRFNHLSSTSQKDRMFSLIGKGVEFRIKGKTKAGILEYCEIDGNYKIRLRGTLRIVLKESDWVNVASAGRQFNLKRTVSKKQIEKLEKQSQAISQFSEMFSIRGCGSVLEKSGCIFNVYGNLNRLNNELAEPLPICGGYSIGDFIRPRGQTNYGESFHCSLESSRSSISDDAAIRVIVEAGLSLPDQMVQSRSCHRIVILARNIASYEECGNLISGQSFHPNGFDHLFDLSIPQSIITLSYYH